MFSDYLDYVINNLETGELVCLLENEEAAESSFEKFVNDWVTKPDEDCETQGESIGSQFDFDELQRVITCSVGKAYLRARKLFNELPEKLSEDKLVKI